MFTSRAEYRLHLRADNADLRLTEKGAEVGVEAGRLDKCLARSKLVEDGVQHLDSLRFARRPGRVFSGRRRGAARRETAPAQDGVRVVAMPTRTLTSSKVLCGAER